MRVKKTLVAAAALLFSLSISAAEGASVKLDSKLGHGGQQTWMMIKASDAKGTGAEISSRGFTTSDWAEAIVPGTVLTNLVEQKVYPDPYYGQNNKLKNGFPRQCTHWLGMTANPTRMPPFAKGRWPAPYPVLPPFAKGRWPAGPEGSNRNPSEIPYIFMCLRRIKTRSLSQLR